MGQDAEAALVHGTQQPVGLLVAREIERGMDGADDEVQAPQDIVGQVEATVLQDVDLHAFEHREAVEVSVERVDAIDLLREAAGVQPVRQREPRGMISDGHVLPAACAGGLRHRFQRVPSVAVLRVGMEVAAQVVERHERGQVMCQAGLDLPAVLAQFGLDEGEAERRVDRGFGVSGNAHAVAVEAVFVELQAGVQRALAQGDVVALRPGEVEEGGAETLRRYRAHVDLHAVRKHDARAGRALGENGGDIGRGHEAAHHGAAGPGGHDQVEVTNGVSAPPQAAGGLGSRYAGFRGKACEPRFGHLQGHREPEAPIRRLAGGERLPDALLGLGAKAGDLAQAAVGQRALHVLERADAQCLLQRPCAAGPDAGNVQQFDHARRNLRTQLREQGAAPGVHDLRDLGREIGANTGQRVQVFALRHHALDAAAQVAEHARGIAVGADAEDAGRLQFEQVGDLVEHRRHVGIGDRNGRGFAAPGPGWRGWLHASTGHAHRSVAALLTAVWQCVRPMR